MPPASKTPKYFGGVKIRSESYTGSTGVKELFLI